MSSRKLGLIERYSVARHNVGLFYNLIAGARYTFSPGADLSALFATAVSASLAEHPLLGTVLTDDDTNEPKWARLDKVDEPSLLRWRKQGERLEDVLAELHSTPFSTDDKTRPLWYLVLLPEGNATVMALFVCHHALCDGISSLAFHSTLQRALDGATESHKEVSLSSEPLPRPMEELVSCRPGYALLLMTILAELVFPTWLSVLAGLRKPHFVGKSVPLEPAKASQTAVRMLRVEARQLSALLAAARREKSSLTSLLWASLASAITQTLTGEPTALKGHIAVDQRSLCKPPLPAGCIANCNAGFQLVAPSPFAVGSEKPTRPHTAVELFNLSRFVARELRQPNMRQRAAQIVGLLQFIPEKTRAADSPYRYDTGWEQFFRAQGERSERSGAFAVSNLGVKPIASSKTCKVEDMLFSQSTGAIAALIVLSTVTCNDVLQCVFSWQKGALSEAESRSVVQRFAANLDLLAR